MDLDRPPWRRAPDQESVRAGAARQIWHPRKTERKPPLAKARHRTARDRICGILPRRRRRRPPVEIGRHTSELQSLMRISYAVFCLKKKTKNRQMTERRNDTYG